MNEECKPCKKSAVQKIASIANGVMNTVIGNNEVADKAAFRRLHCYEAPNKCVNNKNIAGVDVCIACNCVIKLKTNSSNEVCPIGKW